MLSTLFSENGVIYEVIWKNIAEPDRTQITVWRMRIACRIPKSTNTHSEYVILALLFLFHYDNVYKNTPQSYVICTKLVLHFYILFNIQKG